MSVLFETSLGDLIFDLDTERCPRLSANFLKLAKAFKYNFCAFFNVQRDFVAQSGDPTDSGEGGSCVWNVLPASSPEYSSSRLFPAEFPRQPPLRHDSLGTLSMACIEGQCASQFFITLADKAEYLDGKHAVFGRLVEGEDTLAKMNDALVDAQFRPMRDIRIRHVIVLDDPFPDPVGLDVPPESPVPTAAQLKSLRVGDEEELEEDGDADEIAARKREREARAQALTLEMVGDLPFADVAPPENVLFVCKLNAVTRSEDLELIFSRFGKIMSCEVITDQKTGDSLQYAFIEFAEREDAERAFAKMDNVLVDDRRIHVDFSQSVSKLHQGWVFNKTGGRPPPNKGGGRGGRTGGGRGGYGGGRDRGEGSQRRSYSPDGHAGADMVFDLNDYDRRERHKPRERARDDRPRDERPRDDMRYDRGGDRRYDDRRGERKDRGYDDRKRDRRKYDDRRRDDRYDDRRRDRSRSPRRYDRR